MVYGVFFGRMGLKMSCVWVLVRLCCRFSNLCCVLILVCWVLKIMMRLV